MTGLITSDRGLITSDRFKRFPANLPIGESLLSFNFIMHMCLLCFQNNVCEFDSFNLVGRFAIIAFQKLTSCFKTKHSSPVNI